MEILSYLEFIKSKVTDVWKCKAFVRTNVKCYNMGKNTVVYNSI